MRRVSSVDDRNSRKVIVKKAILTISASACVAGLGHVKWKDSVRMSCLARASFSAKSEPGGTKG